MKIKFVIGITSCFLIVLIVILTPDIQAQTITLDQKVPFDKVAQHSGLAGDDIVNTYENVLGDIELTIKGELYDKTWKVDIHRVDGHWNSNFVLEARAVHNSIIGGDTYQVVNSAAQEFFRSNNKKIVNNVQLQHRVSGVSAAVVVAGSYDTTIFYTLVDL